MPTLDTYKKQAKLLLRWHREGNYSIGGRIRQLPRYRTLTDREALALKFPLVEAQEIIALEAGYEGWAELKAAVTNAVPAADTPGSTSAVVGDATPVIFVADVLASSAFYRDRLGFEVDFLHGHPPFYGSVSRNAATEHLRFVHEPVYAPDAQEREEGLIMAFITVENVKGLYSEYSTAGVDFAQKLTKQAWGGTDFIVRDPDGNGIGFVG